MTFRILLTLITVLFAAKHVLSAEEILQGDWKVVSIRGNGSTFLSSAKTIAFSADRTEFSSDAGMLIAKAAKVTDHGKSKTVAFEGPLELNGGDISFQGSASFTIKNGMINMKWSAWALPIGIETRDIKVDMWLERMPDLERELSGTWEVYWCSENGQLDENKIGERWVIDERDLFIKSSQPGTRSEYRLSFQPDRIPIGFDRSWQDSDRMPFHYEKGIVKKRPDGTLVVALSRESSNAPTDFASIQGDKISLYMLKPLSVRKEIQNQAKVSPAKK